MDEIMDIKRPKMVLIASFLLFVSAIFNLISFLESPMFETKSYNLLFATILIAISYLVIKINYLTKGIIASLFFGFINILVSIGTKTFGLSIFFNGLGPMLAAIIGFFARRKIDWLVERESASFRELMFTLKFLRRSKVTITAMGVIVILYTIAVISPYISPYNPLETHMADALSPPSSKYLLGTDHLGRDLLSRLLYGSQTSIVVGILVVIITFSIGIPLGAISGYVGGVIDEALMRFTDMLMAFPGITLAMVFAFTLGRGLFSALIGLSLVGWTLVARIVRGNVLAEKEKEYVLAAKAVGMSNFRILFTEILPNAIQPAIVLATMRLGGAILGVAGLGFVGVGIQPPTPDWGVMINEGRQYLMEQPLYAILPGFFIVALVLSFNLLGDALRDAFDPRLRREM